MSCHNLVSKVSTTNELHINLTQRLAPWYTNCLLMPVGSRYRTDPSSKQHITVLSCEPNVMELAISEVHVSVINNIEL